MSPGCLLRSAGDGHTLIAVAEISSARSGVTATRCCTTLSAGVPVVAWLPPSLVATPLRFSGLSRAACSSRASRMRFCSSCCPPTALTKWASPFQSSCDQAALWLATSATWSMSSSESTWCTTCGRDRPRACGGRRAGSRAGPPGQGRRCDGHRTRRSACSPVGRTVAACRPPLSHPPLAAGGSRSSGIVKKFRFLKVFSGCSPLYAEWRPATQGELKTVRPQAGPPGSWPCRGLERSPGKCQTRALPWDRC